MADIQPKRRHGDLMAELKRKLDGITAVVPRSRPVIFLDYPIHGNMGDLLIHAGTDRFFAENGYDVLGQFSIHEFCRTHRPGMPIAYFKDSVKRLDALARNDATIVFQGGGNLGDLYRDHQMFRELVIQRYKSTPIVILPQSVHFDDAQNQKATAAVFASHPHLYLFARDQESLDFAQADCGVPSSLMPDMAHALWDYLPRRGDANGRLLNFRRRDKEAAGAAGGASETFDWDDLTSGFDRIMIRLLRKMQSMDFPSRHIVPNHVVWGWQRDRLLRRSVGHVGKYGRLVTDRLHGLILGALLDMPLICEDNSYGKVSRYYSAWFEASDRIEHRRHRNSSETAARAPAAPMGVLREYGI